MKKARFFYLDPSCNAGKRRSLDDLVPVYDDYLQACVDWMLKSHKHTISRPGKQGFFPQCDTLTSQFTKSAREHAIQKVKGWVAGKYYSHLKNYITALKRSGEISELDASVYYIIGKTNAFRPRVFTTQNKIKVNITQDHIDAYWAWLTNPAIAGEAPTVSARDGIRFSMMTGILSKNETSVYYRDGWWLRISTLKSGTRVELPLVGSPYVDGDPGPRLSTEILARKVNDTWRFEITETTEVIIPEPDYEAPRVGVDAGKNVLASTSDGNNFGAEHIPLFDQKLRKIKELRANRQRQGLRENSKRLDRLEASLTGYMKTIAGTVANQLIRIYACYTIVIEDLDLRGCKGSKRFAYHLILKLLESKIPVIKVNPACTSQECPRCGYFAKSNRSGIRFKCKHCGHICHADTVGAQGVVRRSYDATISCDTEISVVKQRLSDRFYKRWDRTVESVQSTKRATVAPESHCFGKASMDCDAIPHRLKEAELLVCT